MRRFLENIILAVIVVLWVFPIVWMILGAFKTHIEIFNPLIIFPPNPSLKNFYEALFHPYPYAVTIVNSLIVASVTNAIGVPLAIFAAYSLSRFSIRGGRNIQLWILSTQFAPVVAFLLPLYILMISLGLVDTYFALIIVYLMIVLPFAIWLMKGFIDDLPREYEEAALIDGCSRVGTLIRVVVPILTPAIVVTTAFTFGMTINEFFIALILTAKDSMTMPVAMFSFWTTVGIAWEKMCAFGILMIIPALIISLAVRKYIVRGMTFGAVKG